MRALTKEQVYEAVSDLAGDAGMTADAYIASLLRQAEEESLVIDACEDIPKSFLVCDHPYHPQLVYLSELSSATLQRRMDEQQ